ncbi:MAG: DEAD/DEAH box helicase [Myxococcales bacterium]|nr:DEAD/DEAH box helicase [Myxococcales bacterium]
MQPTGPAFSGDRRAPWRVPRGLAAAIAAWEADPRVRSNFTLDVRSPPRPARMVPLPSRLAPGVAAALAKRGIESLYSHQAEAFELSEAGHDVVVATPTASGKSLCFNLPVLHRFAVEPEARALYLFPTKALSRDQEEALRALLREAGLGHGAITYDGDTPGDARRAGRERSGVLLTNPDMLHSGILPHHANWARLFANLRYVVLDELHMYRGVFGSHLANVVRRLQRIARFHGADPQFILASATIGNPGEHAARIIGRPVRCIGESGAPAGPRRLMVYNPPVVNAELGVRANYLKTAVRLAADLVRAEVPTLVFGQTRNSVEVMLKYLRDRLADDTSIPKDAIVAYRGGYLPNERRRTEAGLRAGEIRCVVSTNALEMGIDIGALDAVICAGYPGSIAGLWQRFGRAGRRQEESLAVLVASSTPVDQFVAHGPQRLLDAPIEHARIDPDNVEILIDHLKCGSFELPFESDDAFGDVPREVLHDGLDFLAQHQVVHPVTGPKGRTWHWSTDAYPASHVSLRSIGWDNFVIIDVDIDKTIAEMDWRSTHTMLHEQAIYQHDGEQYQVERLDFDNRKAFVRRVVPDYFTTAEIHTKVTVTTQDESVVPAEPTRRLHAGLGEVSVVEKVVGFKKVKFHSHENVGYGEVHLPEMQMHTSAFWLTVPEAFVAARPEPRPSIIDALRGLNKAMHIVAAAGLMIDPRDLGRCLGDRDAADAPPSTGGGPGFDPTLFLYDKIPGGIGLAPRLFDERDALLRRSASLIARCDCGVGCPACIGPAVGMPPAGVRPPRPLVLDLLAALGVEPG